MTSLRPVTYALLASSLLAATGCRTAGVGNLARPDPLPSRAEESAADLLVEHNRNAERVQSLQSDSTITSTNRGKIGGLSGKLAMELPRNFKLSLTAGLQNVADIGSNDQEFWFWIKDAPDKAVFYCNYNESGTSPLAAAGLQPDWIVEAMGLRYVSDEEAARIKVTTGKEPGTVVLTERQKTSQGDSLIKETVMNESTGRILEHWVYSSDKTPLAHALVTEYKDYPVPSQPGASTETVHLPCKFRLEWMQKEKLALNVTLSRVAINPKFPPEKRQALFVEPKFEGYARVNLERTGMASRRPAPDSAPGPGAGAGPPPTSVRETLPAPPPRVRLTEPAPLGLDGARRNQPGVSTAAADLPKAYARGIEEVVGPPIPTSNDPLPQVVKARTGWLGSMASGLER